MATTTVYNGDITDANGKVLTAAGTYGTDVYGPARYATLEDGTYAWLRPHTHTDYDQGAPNNGVNPTTGLPYRLPTASTLTAFDPGTGTDMDTVSMTRTGYDPVGSDPSGWTLGAPTSSTTVMAGSGNDITTTTRYDAEGKVIETRGATSTGADPGTELTTYYTAAANASVPVCGGKPQWAGLVCQTAPGDGAGSVVPTVTTSGYNYLLQPTVVTEAAGGVTRTTTTTYLSDGRPSTVATATTGLTGSATVAATKTKYDPTTGLATDVVALDGAGNETTTKQTTGYDAWGRAITYSPSDGSGTTTTVYDAAGRPLTVTDPKGTTTWTWDGTDALGHTEHRSLPTALAVSNSGGAAVRFTGAYDADGVLTTQTLPGGITQTVGYDPGGSPVDLAYSGQVTTGGVTNPSSAWLAWSVKRDVTGRIREEWTPEGSAFTDGAGGNGTVDTGNAIAYDRQYHYDRAGRLVQVDDRTATATGTALDPTAPVSTTSPCQTRVYGFDKDGHRTGLTRRDANPDGSCATTGGTTTTWSYDAADRITTGANVVGSYVYDALGRATTVPGVDTPHGSTAGNLTLGYYDNDAVHTLTQNGVTTTYTLDVTGRRLRADTTGGTASTLIRRYTDGSDNPGWVEATTGGITTITRYAESLGGELAATIDGAGAVQLPLANLHGDTVTTVDIPATGNATTIDAWADYDEYGNPRDAVAADAVGGAAGYAWLGAKQRATDDTGLVLMGARLYNPITAQFTSIDPVQGGNETDYSYPADPVNSYDLDGHSVDCGCYPGGTFAGFPDPPPAPKHHHWWNKAASSTAHFVEHHKVDIALTAATFIPGVGEVAWAARAAEGAGEGLAAARAARAAAKLKQLSGREIKIGKNIRIAPLGNRTGHPIGRYPHYHRRGLGADGETRAGQGIGRHRPWEKKSTDRRFRDRF
jgi:RHS repeat-associated protein